MGLFQGVWLAQGQSITASVKWGFEPTYPWFWPSHWIVSDRVQLLSHPSKQIYFWMILWRNSRAMYRNFSPDDCNHRARMFQLGMGTHLKKGGWLRAAHELNPKLDWNEQDSYKLNQSSKLGSSFFLAMARHSWEKGNWDCSGRDFLFSLSHGSLGDLSRRKKKRGISQERTSFPPFPQSWQAKLKPNWRVKWGKQNQRVKSMPFSNSDPYGCPSLIQIPVDTWHGNSQDHLEVVG